LKAWSGGMRQRLGIAQALAGDPQLIIVDEPTAGLDPEERRRFYRLLAELSAGRTVLLSTHIVEDVSVLCSRFAVIRSGRVLCETTPGDARKAIRGRIFAGTVDGGGYEALVSSHRVLQALPREGRSHVRLYEAGDAPPSGFEPAEPTLEDAYLVMMQEAQAGLASPVPAARRAEPA
ncbi:MAG: AAA family ATPase, partial [Planctomycetota bacterium]